MRPPAPHVSPRIPAQALLALALAGTALLVGLWVARSPALLAGLLIELPLLAALAFGYAGLHQDGAGARSTARRIFVLALAVRLVALVAVFLAFAPGQIAPDQVLYDKYGRYLALAWSGQVVPAKVETHRWAFYYHLCAVLYTLLGHNALLPRLLNAVAGALSAALLYRLARRWAGERAAWWAGLLAALFPSLVLWSSLGIRDPLVVVSLVLGFDLLDRFRERPDLGALAALAATFGLIVLLRDYMAAMLAASMGAALLAGGGERVSGRRFVASVAAVVLVAIALHELGYADPLVEAASLSKLQTYREGMAVGRAAYGAGVDISTPGKALTFLPVGVAYFLLAPFPWSVGSTRQLMAVPETYLWWALLPFTAMGVIHLWRTRRGRVAPVLVFLASVTGTYSLVEGNMGTAYRHRAQVIIFFLLFTGVGIAQTLERRRAALGTPAASKPPPARAAARGPTPVRAKPTQGGGAGAGAGEARTDSSKGQLPAV